MILNIVQTRWVTNDYLFVATNPLEHIKVLKYADFLTILRMVNLDEL